MRPPPIPAGPARSRKSLGKSTNIGSSVEPGLPKTVFMAKPRSSANTASRTVGRARVATVPGSGSRQLLHAATINGFRAAGGRALSTIPENTPMAQYVYT